MNNTEITKFENSIMTNKDIFWFNLQENMIIQSIHAIDQLTSIWTKYNEWRKSNA